VGWIWFALLWVVFAAVYVLVAMSSVPGLREERFGRRGRLPPGLDAWRADAESPEGQAAKQGGLIREQRVWLYERGWLGKRPVLQVRYRDPATGEIARVEPERPLRWGELSALASEEQAGSDGA
jgi:hypothetical protein